MGSTVGTLVPSELSGDEQRRLRAWETALRAEPQRVRAFGVPSWLVQKHLNPSKDGSDFTEMSEKLRKQYGLDVEYGVLGWASGDKVDMSPSKALLGAKMSPNVPKSADVPIEIVPKVEMSPMCVGCHERPPEKGRNICAGCRKRAWRAR